MRLALIRPACDYQLLAVCARDGECSVLEEIERLRGIDAGLFEEVAGVLYNRVPFWGPPSEHTKSLGHEIWEFKFGRQPGLGFRVVWFYGDGFRQLICTMAFLKGGGRPNPASFAKKQALAYRSEYGLCLAEGRIEIEPIGGTI